LCDCGKTPDEPSSAFIKPSSPILLHQETYKKRSLYTNILLTNKEEVSRQVQSPKKFIFNMNYQTLISFCPENDEFFLFVFVGGEWMIFHL
jgi:hypothetical protein